MKNLLKIILFACATILLISGIGILIYMIVYHFKNDSLTQLQIYKKFWKEAIIGNISFVLSSALFYIINKMGK